MAHSPSSKTYKTGYVAIAGRPNVGKSTLINALLGQKVAAVSPRPQTTRKRQLGILSTDSAQIIFVDTPGIHLPHHRLGEFMNTEAREALADVDLIVFVVDGSAPPHEEDRLIVLEIQKIKRPPPVILAFNKSDLTKDITSAEMQLKYQALLPQAFLLPISATQGKGLDHFVEEIIERLPEGSPFFNDEQITDLSEREISADLIREAALLHLRDEVPHCIAVRIDEFTERGDSGAYIAATIFVERDSQKGIVIGAGGVMLKKIGSTARQEIESMSGRKVYLELRVKIQKNWRQDNHALTMFGLGSTDRK